MPDRKISDTDALDAMAEWLQTEGDGEQWGSACDYIERSAELLQLTGRDTEPKEPR